MTWRTSTLGEIVRESGGLIQSGPFGSQLHQADYVTDGVPAIMPKDIAAGEVDERTVARVSESTADRLRRHRLSPGAIVLPRRGDVSKRAFIREEQSGWLCGTGCLQVGLSGREVLPEFLYYYMELPAATQWLEQNAVGSTMLNLSASIVSKLPVRFPSLTTQRRISTLLRTFDDLVANNRRRMALHEEAARQLFREWFVRLRFPGHEHTAVRSGVPSGWSLLPLSALCLGGIGIQTGPFGSQLHQSDYTDEGVPVVMPKDIARLRIDTDSTARISSDLASRLCRHRLEVGDTVYGRRGDIGRRAYVGPRQAGALCGTGCLRLRPDPVAVSPIFFFDALGSPDTAGTIANRAKGATMPNLNATVLRSVPVLVPTRSLQDLYAEHVETMMKMTDVLEQQSDRLKAARDLLLPRLMSGNLAL